jgi:histone H2A
MATPKRSQKKAASAGTKKNKADLIFPTGRCGGLLRRGRFARRVSASAGVYMAAVLEYLTAELLELSCKATAGSKKNAKRITPRALTLAVRSDDDLGNLLKDVSLSRGGVVPNVHSALNKKAKKSKKSKKGSKKSKKH